MRLIDADALIDNKFKNDISYNAFVNLVKRQPIVDAVPVVRCKDCKYHDDEEPGAVYCPDRVGGWVSEDFFCAGGERRQDDAVFDNRAGSQLGNIHAEVHGQHQDADL